MADNELQQAITAIKSGDKALGRSILVRIIQQQPKNELAWLWLSACVNTDDQKRDCLKKVLEINPENQNALQALNRLTLHIEEPTPEEMASKEKPIPEIPKQQVSTSVPVSHGQIKQKKKSSSIPTILFSGLVVIIIAAIVIIAISLFKNIVPLSILGIPISPSPTPTLDNISIKNDVVDYYDSKTIDVPNIFTGDGTTLSIPTKTFFSVTDVSVVDETIEGKNATVIVNIIVQPPIPCYSTGGIPGMLSQALGKEILSCDGPLTVEEEFQFKLYDSGEWRLEKEITG